MARYTGADVGFVLMDGYDIRGYLTRMEIGAKEAVLEATHTLGDAWQKQTFAGVRSGGLTMEGFYDDAALAINEALVASVGSPRIVAVGLAGGAIGRPAIGYAGPLQGAYERALTRGELHKVRAVLEPSAEVDEAVVLHGQSAETTASGNTQSSPVDNGAGTTGGGAAYLQVPALTLGGYTSVTIKVRHSADNITYADLATFGAVTAAPAAQRVTVAGTVQRYLAMSWAFNGAGSGQSITPVIIFARY